MASSGLHVWPVLQSAGNMASALVFCCQGHCLKICFFAKPMQTNDAPGCRLQLGFPPRERVSYRVPSRKSGKRQRPVPLPRHSFACPGPSGPQTRSCLASEPLLLTPFALGLIYLPSRVLLVQPFPVCRQAWQASGMFCTHIPEGLEEGHNHPHASTTRRNGIRVPSVARSSK